MMGSQTNKTNTLLKAGSSVSIHGAGRWSVSCTFGVSRPLSEAEIEITLIGCLGQRIDLRRACRCSFHDFTHSVRCLHMFLLLLLCQWHLQYFNHTYSRSEVAILAKKCCFFITMFFFELVGRQLHNSAWNKFSLIKIRKIKKIGSCNFHNIFD